MTNILKRRFPEFHVCVRRVKLPDGTVGECSKNRKKFMIKIDRNLSELLALETLLHEWAHVLAWGKPGDWHGAEWGKAFSRVYRIYLRDYLDED